MKHLIEILGSLSKKPISILGKEISIEKYTPIDLSTNNVVLENLDITDPDICQAYIDSVLEQMKATVAYGGYLEKRNLYNDKSTFSKEGTSRNIHLGIDFWAKAGTNVEVPHRGKVHSFRNNATIGDYGPTIILEHYSGGSTFYTLYGHLSMASLENVYIGKPYNTGDIVGTLGTPDINVNYAPHLHFQIIENIEGFKGDYQGVCSKETLDFFKKNCPDPNFLLKI